ncbi:hypothetical protein [Loktanella sp. SALINAS62]|uniref:RcgA family putative transporter n=1 Tax=Loktanella sp. SALINAS62 TaxID=2706124 RepID=UPI0032C453A1
MVKGKYFVAPSGENEDFKTLFRHLAAAGAGRPADANGFPQGPWTPDLLAEAISQIDANRAGIDLRTVQLWFQDNDKGISSENIRWLARILGCGDPGATSAWQAELSASQSRLTAKRRQRRSIEEPPFVADESAILEPDAARLELENNRPRRFSLARQSETIFGNGSYLDLPSSVFAGAVALGFVSVFVGIHSITYARDDGIIKQVGFLWAPNWTLLFMVFLPLFFGFAVELLAYWKNEGRPLHLDNCRGAETDVGWMRKVEASRYTYWAVFIICVGFAGIFQWVSVRLIPLMDGSSDHPIDWGSVGIERPDVISVGQEAVFTGVAYLYMSLCFYLFFVGLILLYTVSHDFWEIAQENKDDHSPDASNRTASISDRIVRGVFRCTLMGLFVAICMKLEAGYLVTDSTSVPGWLADDTFLVLLQHGESFSAKNYISPTQYTSLIIGLATIVPFFYTLFRVGPDSGPNAGLSKMIAAILILVVAYVSIGAFNGFSILIWTAILISVFGLVDPGYGSRKPADEGDNGVVS